MTTVLHSAPVWLPQTQTWLYNQVRYLPADIACHVVCERTENLGQFEIANIHALRDRSSLQYLWDKGLVKLGLRSHSGYMLDRISTLGADLVHSHFGHVAWRDMHACTRAAAAQVATFYGFEVNLLPRANPEWRRRYEDLFASVARVLCEGPHMAKCVVVLGCPERKVLVHHLGVALAEIDFKPRVWDGDGPLRILIAGSFREKKGIPYALKALGKFQHRVPLEITIVGDADSSPASQAEKRNILTIIEQEDLGRKSRLLGFQEHAVLMEEAYRHHIFISPSVTARDGDTEGGAPVSILEMAATGMPVVSTRHCDIPEVIQDGVTGLLADERDSEGLVQCLERLLNQPKSWRGMLTAARNRLERDFDARTQGKKLGKIYRALIG